MRMESESDKGKKQIRFIIVPMFIIEDNTLLDGEKLLFGEIASNSLEKNYCWFSNKHLAKLFHISERTASRWINDLKIKAYITVEMKCKPGSKEIEERRIRVNTSNPMLAEYMNWYRQPCPQGIATNGNFPVVTDDAGNSKGINNKDYLKDITNVLLSTYEYQSLIDEFDKENLDSVITEYSNWKQRVNAHPRSDFDSLRKWLSKALPKYKGNVSSAIEIGADEVTDEMLADLPF